MKNLILSVTIGISSIVSLSTALYAQETLVKDLNTLPAGFRPSNDYSELFCQCGDYLFFAVPGKELWRTDGTAEGTISLGDIKKGYDQGFAGFWTMACAENKTLFFQANDGVNGWELWTSDGTKSGTKMVKDVVPGANENWGFFNTLGLLDNTYYFLVDHDRDNQLNLWKSKGSANTTEEVSDFPAFASASLVAISDTHIFIRTLNPVSQKNELWATDGTGANTVKLQDDYSFGISKSIGQRIMFSVNNPSDNSYSLWSSDGTVAGTFMVRNFGSQYLQKFNRFNDKLIFNVYSETWISDGTDAGTTYLASGGVDAAVVLENDFYGFGYDFSSGSHRLLKTDGSAVEFFDMGGSNYGDVLMVHTIAAIDGGLILQYGYETLGQEVAMFNTTTKIFTLVKDINEGPNNSSPKAWSVLNDNVYFLADDGLHGTEIWRTDGTTDGTFLLKDILSETGNAFRSTYFSTTDVVTSEGKLQIVAEPGLIKSAIYGSTGNEEGTTSKVELTVPTTSFLGKVNEDVIFFNDRKFYKTRGTSDDVTLIKDLSSDIFSLGYSDPSYSFAGKMVFRFGTYAGNIVYGDEFWVTDGTEAGTHVLKDINPGAGHGVGYEAALLGSTKLIFQGGEPGSGAELWITDGTTEGTTLLKDIFPGSEGSKPEAFVSFHDKVIFTANDGVHGSELWITNGTPEGTMLLADIVSGTASAEARHLRSGKDFVFFSVYDIEKGWTLWKTNGTAIGTTMVIDVAPGNDKNTPHSNLGSVGNKFYFAANDGVHGQELWVTDGTEAGTHVIDVVTGGAGSSPLWVADAKGIAYFKADASLWRTNGTQQGTFKVSDLEPFSVTVLENWLYFKAFHPDYGIELFKVPITKVDQQIVAEPIPTKTFGDQPFEIIASATSGLPVTVTTSGEVTMAGKTATIVKPGSVCVRIRQEGDALFNTAESVCQSFCILPSKPVITITSSVPDIVLESSADAGNQWFGPNGEIAGENDRKFSTAESGSYRVQVTIEGCQSELSDEKVLVITGIENPEDLLTLYPNPAKEQFTVQATGYQDEIRVDILNLQGKPLDGFKMLPGQSVNYSLQGYPSGIYLVKVVTSQGTAYQKVVKE